MPSAAPLRATFHELGLHSPNPQGLADFYHRALGYGFAASDDGLTGIASERRIGIRRGPAKTLAYAAYAVADADSLDSLARRLRTAGTAFARVDRAGFEPAAIAVADPDGNSFLFGIAEGGAPVVADDTARRLARLQHVVFATTDIERELAFFTDVLGFTLSDRVVDEQGRLRTAFVRCSDEHHSLAVFAASECRLDHHCYEAGDWGLIRDWADHFAGHRIALKWGPGRHGPGNNLFLFIHDPDGNWVEISAELERVDAQRPVGDWPHEEYTLNSWGIGLLRS
jgi:catechol 2,3-dioxygenase